MSIVYKLPSYYYECKEIVDLQNALNTEAEVLTDNIETLINDLFISSCSSISKWETLFNIKVDINKDIEFRRSVILSKIRAQGTTTKQMIKTVAESFSNGTVDVIEDNANCKFIIKFISAKGIPPNMEDFRNTINEIKPAHLDVGYEYTYNNWDMIENISWGSVNTISWEKLKTR